MLRMLCKISLLDRLLLLLHLRKSRNLEQGDGVWETVSHDMLICVTMCVRTATDTDMPEHLPPTPPSPMSTDVKRSASEEELPGHPHAEMSQPVSIARTMTAAAHAGSFCRSGSAASEMFLNLQPPEASAATIDKREAHQKASLPQAPMGAPGPMGPTEPSADPSGVPGVAVQAPPRPDSSMPTIAHPPVPGAGPETSPAASKLPDTAASKLPDTAASKLPDTAPSKLPDAAPSKLPDTAASKLPDTAPSKLPDTAVLAGGTGDAATGPGSGADLAPCMKVTSVTHPAAYRSYGRFVARNPECRELARAWAAGGDQRLAMLTKWVAAGGVMKKQREISETDKGRYVGPEVVVAHFHGDAVKASSFMRRRLSEPKGSLDCIYASCYTCLCNACHADGFYKVVAVCSGFSILRTKKDLNDPTVMKFLLYDDSEFSSVTKTVAAQTNHYSVACS